MRKKLIAATTAFVTVLTMSVPVASAASPSAPVPKVPAKVSDTTKRIPTKLRLTVRVSLNTDKLIAAKLRISTKRLRSELAKGATLAQIAANYGWSGDTLVVLVNGRVVKIMNGQVRSKVVTRSEANRRVRSLNALFRLIVNRSISSPYHGETGKLELFSLESVAAFLGMTKDQLEMEMNAGLSLGTIAVNHGSSVDALFAFLMASATATINAAVASGKISQAEANLMIASLPTRILAFINRVEAKSRNRGRFDDRIALKVLTKEAAAAAIGISTEQLKAELDTGLSIAGVALLHGVPVATLTASLTTYATNVINAAVASGQITQATGDFLKSLLPTMISNFINRVYDDKDDDDSNYIDKVNLYATFVTTAAATIGVSVSDLRDVMEDGVTVAQFAVSRGVSIETVRNALIAAGTARINAALTAGLITQAIANVYLAGLPYLVDGFLNQVHLED